jgi:hypothetical protein
MENGPFTDDLLIKTRGFSIVVGQFTRGTMRITRIMAVPRKEHGD